MGVRTRFIPQRWSHVSTFALIFVVLWVLGTISSYTIGGFIHVFPVMAIGMMLPRLVRGRKVSKY